MAQKRASRSAALPDRISLWITGHRRQLLGGAIIAAAVIIAGWASMAGAPLPDQRRALVAALGGGLYLVALVVAAGRRLRAVAAPSA